MPPHHPSPFALAVIAALLNTSAIAATGTAQVSLAGQTVTVSGNIQQDSPTGPAYVSNPNGFYFTVTDGITTVSGQERRNNDPVGGPNKALQSIATFDGSQATISGTINAVSFSPAETGQSFGIGVITSGALQKAAISYNSNIVDGFAGFGFEVINGHLYALAGISPESGTNLDLTNVGLANGPVLSGPVPFVITLAAGSVSATVGGYPVGGAVTVPYDLSKVVLVVGGFSSSANDGPAILTSASIAAALPTTVGAPSLLYAVSGDNQSAAAGTALPAPVVVGVVDSHRNAVPGAAVSFTATGATVTSASAQTDVKGQASTQVTLGNAGGPATVTATVNGMAAVTFHLTATANPLLPNITGVVNGASFLPQIVAGSWVTIQGTNLSATTRPWGASDFVNGAPPIQLDNVSATINGKAAYIYYISPKQLNILAPDDAATGPVAVQVTNSAGVTNTFTANKAALSPALFLFTSPYPAAVHADGTYVGPPQLIAGATTTPAKPNEIIMLYGTGFGATNPIIQTGFVFTNPAPLAESVTATVGGMPANVQGFLISPGLYQFNLTVPNLPNGDAPLEITIGGSSTPDGLLLTVGQ
jgi:uncharacterized protein (TIGR03437 family)